MIRPPLACTVRDCGQPLARGEHVFVCARGHSYDVARSGYVNLLQPQDRRSPVAGDTKAAVHARARLLAAGIGHTILADFVQCAASLPLPDSSVVVDLGAGSGDALASLAESRAIAGIGIDISRAATDRAARRFPEHMWVVANADRRLPLLDRSVDLMLSLHARRNPAECARVLKSTGFLLVAVPARDDLIELRASVQGQRIERDRADVLQAEHDGLFAVVQRSCARERRRVGRDELLDLLQGTYRGERAREAARVQALADLEVTLASDFLVFAPR